VDRASFNEPNSTHGEVTSGMELGSYRREAVSNLQNDDSRRLFDDGLRLMLSYQHELASSFFLRCLEQSPYCVLAHGLIALCQSNNYNFKGTAYWVSADHPEDVDKSDHDCVFPSQQLAERHSRQAVEKMEAIRRLYRKRNGGKGKKGKGGSKVYFQEGNNDDPQPLSSTECRLVTAIRILTCMPGVAAELSDELVGRPFADEMRKVYQEFPNDPEVIYIFAESLMILNAWNLYEYPSGKALSKDVVEVRNVLESGLQRYPTHAGLCHMYVHLSEMSSHPELALMACVPLRDGFPHAGHLIHMPTHIDVLVGDYESCVKYNRKAIAADQHAMRRNPLTAGKESFYFGYIVHDYHMAVYGAILGGMEAMAMSVSQELNEILTEEMFAELPDLVSYLEGYSAMEVHTMVRFGRWDQLLQVPLPKDENLMLFRTASIRFGRALALAMSGHVDEAKAEADILDKLMEYPEADFRILHNNSVKRLLIVDAVMLRGEIAYREGQYDDAFDLLRKAVYLQDSLNFDEPWGKMQPVRHALGGLLLEQNRCDEAIEVFRADLAIHPRNPWALVGLINSLKAQDCCSTKNAEEIASLRRDFDTQQKCEWADFTVDVACECCKKKS